MSGLRNAQVSDTRRPLSRASASRLAHPVTVVFEHERAVVDLSNGVSFSSALHATMTGPNDRTEA